MSTLIETIRRGQTAANDAEAARQDLRWNVKPGTKARERVIERHLKRIDSAMRPIRSAVGRIAGGWESVAPPLEARLREASRSLQYQRKQLKKMRR